VSKLKPPALRIGVLLESRLDRLDNITVRDENVFNGNGEIRRPPERAWTFNDNDNENDSNK